MLSTDAAEISDSNESYVCETVKRKKEMCFCLPWSEPLIWRKLGPQFMVTVVHDRHEQKREMSCTRKH